MSVKGGEVFKVDLTVFNGATDGANYSDMTKFDTSVSFQSGCMNIVFLNKFVNDLLVRAVLYCDPTSLVMAILPVLLNLKPGW